MPTNLARQLLRTCVLKTNAYWPFRQCSRATYAAAIKAFLIMLRGSKQIADIYLRNGMTESGWIPGLSDIDLILVLRNNLSEEQEYDFLASFWKAYQSLRFCFPMLGEVDILDESAFAPWLAHSSLSPEKRGWILLHGRGEADLAFDGCSGWRRRALNNAICIYLDLFVPCFAMPDSFTHRLDLQRRARKILRLLQPIFAEAGQTTEFGPYTDPIDLMANVLVALEKAVALVASESGPEHEASAWQVNESNRDEPLPIPPCAQYIRSVVILKDRKVWMLLKDGLERREIHRVILACQGSWQSSYEAPVVVPFSLFAHIVRDYYPYDYSNLQRHRQVAFGTDPLSDIAPPDRARFVNHAMDHIPNALKYAGSEELFALGGNKHLLPFESSLNRALSVRLLLGDDWTRPDWKDVVAQCRAAFPECFRMLEDINNEIKSGRRKSARETSFRLFRPIATSIQDLLVERKQAVLGSSAA